MNVPNINYTFSSTAFPFLISAGYVLYYNTFFKRKHKKYAISIHEGEGKCKGFIYNR